MALQQQWYYLNTPVVSSTIDKVKSAVENFFDLTILMVLLSRVALMYPSIKENLPMQHHLMLKIKLQPLNVITMGLKSSPKVVKVCLSTDSLLLEKEMAQNVVQKLVMVLLIVYIGSGQGTYAEMEPEFNKLRD